MSASTARAGSRYFVRMHAIMLVVVLLAFAPTFYLRPWVPQPPILDLPVLPRLFIVHGIILVAWYVFLLQQSRWIQQRSVAQHRTAGWFGAGLAVAVLASTLMIVYHFPGRVASLAATRGVTVDDLEPGLIGILWLDVVMCILFPALVIGGIVMRRRAQIHKRLMLFAGITFLFAATARLGAILGVVTGLPLAPIVGFGLLLGLTVSLPIHDRRTLGRIQPVTWVCLTAYWGGTALSVVLANSGIREWVLNW